MTWLVKDVNFIQHPLIGLLMTYDTQYNNREIDHNYSSDDSSRWAFGALKKVALSKKP